TGRARAALRLADVRHLDRAGGRLRAGIADPRHPSPAARALTGPRGPRPLSRVPLAWVNSRMRTAEPAGDAGPVVKGTGLVVRRGGHLVLDGLTFSLAPGKVTGLLGPSGCGKTTLMRVLVGVQEITAGTVTVLGWPAGHPRLRARLGYATQAAAVYPDLTLRENLRYFGTVLGLRGRPLA